MVIYSNLLVQEVDLPHDDAFLVSLDEAELVEHPGHEVFGEKSRASALDRHQISHGDKSNLVELGAVEDAVGGPAQLELVVLRPELAGGMQASRKSNGAVGAHAMLTEDLEAVASSWQLVADQDFCLSL